MYFDDFEIDSVFKSPGRTITEADLTLFSGLSGDYNELHTNEAFAKETQFKRRVVHGMLGLSILTGLMGRTGVFEGTALAMLGIDNWKFRKPLFINDTIHIKFKITEKRRSDSNKNVGIVGRHFSIINQHNEVVQEGDVPVMMKVKKASKEWEEK